MYVSNDTWAKAFQMAAVGYSTLKDDPVVDQKYKDMMSDIIDNNTLAENKL